MNDVMQWLAQPRGLLIDGQWCAAGDGALLDVHDPCTGSLLARVAAGGTGDIDRAVGAARRAFEHGPWASMRPAERARLLWRLAELVDAQADALAWIECLNTGKPLRLARMFDVAMAAESLRYNAGWATKLWGHTPVTSLPGEWHTYTAREPVGVAGLIVPWNVPLPMAVNKLAPALAAGCTVVLKPAELTPLTALRLGELVIEAGIPPGVVNIVPGLGAVAGQALAEHGDVDKIAFTGSTATGRRVVAAATGNMKRVALELGGKSPVFLFADADLERAIDAAARGIFANTGQVCAAGSRLFVQRQVYERVIDGVARRARALRIGRGTDPASEIGPVISAAQRDRVLGYVERGVREGATVLAGGGPIDGPGYFVQPTVLVGTRPEMCVAREEIFGPVLSTFVFEESDAVDALAVMGNATEYGLSASVWTRDLARAHRLARRLRVGNVRINAAVAPDFAMPFGGMKQSGWGRENGLEGVEAFTEVKSVAIDLG